MARRKSNKPMPKELLATFASTHRLNAALRRAGLPQFRDFAAVLRAGAGGDGQAAAWLDDNYPQWRDFPKQSSVEDGESEGA